MQKIPGPVLLLWILSCSAVAAAQEQEPAEPLAPGVGELTEPDELQTTLDVGLGYSRIGEDGFLDTNVGVDMGLGPFSFGVWVPLRFRVDDDPPENDPVIREQDWDEPSDYFRVIRYLQYGSPRDPIYARGGELSGISMGHGTIVSGYNNVIDVNHFQWGINGALNANFGGVEALFDNIADPEVMGLRTYVRPWVFVDPESFWSNLAFGTSFIGDVDAPRRLAQTETGRFIVDGEHNLVVAESEGTAIVGVDTELQVFTNDLVSITPYVDVNFHLDQGSGLHLGNLANFTFSEAVALNTRLELRVMGEGYLPTYIDGLYELERLLFPLPLSIDPTGQRRPKLQVLSLAPPESRLGWYGEGTFGLFGLVYLTLAYEDYDGPDNTSFWARLALPQLGPVTLGAYFVNQSFDGASEMFDLDNALLVAEARAFVYGPVYVIAQFARRFEAQQDGTYEPIDDWGFGAGVRFEL